MVSRVINGETVSLSPYREPAEVKPNVYTVGTAKVSFKRIKESSIVYDVFFTARWFPEYIFYYNDDGTKSYTQPMEVENIQLITSDWIAINYKNGLFRLKKPFHVNEQLYSKDELYIPANSIDRILVEYGTKNVEPEKQPITLRQNRTILSVK